MTLIASVNSAALQILRQDRQIPELNDKPVLAGEDLVAIANGFEKTNEQTKERLASDIFSVSHIDSTQMKVRLMERLGDAFGLNQADYDSAASYGAAIRFTVSQMRDHPEGQQALARIEKNLGLDELGISIDTLVNAIIDPQGNDGDKLDAALKKQTGEDAGAAGKPDAQSVLATVRFDEIGLYSL